MNDLSLSRISLDVNVVSSIGAFPGEELEFLDVGGVTGVTLEVVTCESHLLAERVNCNLS